MAGEAAISDLWLDVGIPQEPGENLAHFYRRVIAFKRAMLVQTLEIAVMALVQGGALTSPARHVTLPPESLPWHSACSCYRSALGAQVPRSERATRGRSAVTTP